MKAINKEKLLIDLSCGFYLVFFASTVKSIIESSVYGGENAFGALILAIIIFVMNGLEMLAVPPMVNQLFYSLKEKDERYKKVSKLILLLFLHAAISIVSVIMAFQLFGYDFKSQPIILTISVVVILAKEIYLVKNIFSENSKKVLSPNTSIVIIALYSCLMLTIFWDATKSETHSDNIPLFIFELLPMALFFAFFYFPLRLPYTFHSIIHKATTKDKLFAFISFLLVFIPAALNKIG